MLKQLKKIFDDPQEIKRRKRSRRSFRGTTNRVKKGMYSNDSFDFLTLIRNWNNIVGDGLANNTAPLKIVHKALIIMTRHSTYSHQLSYMGENIKDKIFSIYPSLRSQIKQIRFQTSERYFTKASKQEQSPQQSIEQKSSIRFHPLSPEVIKNRMQANEEFSDIMDEEIKESLISLRLQQKNKDQAK